MQNVQSRPTGGVRPALILAGVAATSAAGLVFEIALTRVFAIAQFYHFAYLAVSLALLGFGASGSALYAFPRLGRGGPRRWAWLASGQSLSTVCAYAAANTIPFDSFAIAWDRRQLLYLTVYYLALAVPFFFGGLVIAVLLAGGGMADPVSSHRVYAASLVGSGLGAVAALACLDLLGGEGTILFSAALALAAAGAFTLRRVRRVAAAAAVGLLIPAIAVPDALELNLSPYKDLSGALRYPGASVVASDWDQGTRLDLVESDGIRSLPGLSFAFAGIPPRQDGITFDGDDLAAVPRFAPAEAEFASHLLGSLAYSLRPGADALVLEPRGGLGLTVALAGGAASVTAVEPHGGAVDLTRAGGATVYDDSRVTLVVDDPRTYVGGSDRSFDVVALALTSRYRPVTSGAYSLAETYTLTVEAFEQYLDRLAPGGVFTALRWIQTPPSEETRLLALAAEALRRRGVDPSGAAIVLRSYSNSLLLVAPDGFDSADIAEVTAFADAKSFDIVAAPGLTPTNRYNVLPQDEYGVLAAALLGGHPDSIYEAHAFEIVPPTDDRPFFGHFFKWSQASAVLDTLGRTWQPFGGAGYFVLIALLVVSTVAALILIAVPLLVRRRGRSGAPARVGWWTVGYFGLLGAAFMFVEIPLIQQYILLVGRPTTAFTVVLASVLVGSGIGSAWSPRIPWRPGALALTGAALAYPFLVRWFTPLGLPAPALVRMAVAAVMVLPLGVLMGIMFPRGLAHLEASHPQLVPWAWAVNGTVSVIGAVAAALFALSFGFSPVVWAGAVAYGLAALLVRPVTARPE